MESAPIDTCAACGNEGGDSLKACTACHMVKYCNRDCQVAHRPLHKKACKKRATEIYDEKLFKEVEPDECPICLLPLPSGDKTAYQTCCGKIICHGCIYTMMENEGGIGLCAFCRTPPARSYTEENKRLKKLMSKGNAEAFNFLASLYARGINGLPQDEAKANELFLKAGELGCAVAYYNLANAYSQGRGVGMDKKKANHYWELAAMNGHVRSRHNIGCMEANAGNTPRAFKHFIIAAKAGSKDSLDIVQQGFFDGIVSKDEFANTLRAYQESNNEMKSEARDRAPTGAAWASDPRLSTVAPNVARTP